VESAEIEKRSEGSMSHLSGNRDMIAPTRNNQRVGRNVIREDIGT
jgi:hypothetical protein